MSPDDIENISHTSYRNLCFCKHSSSRQKIFSFPIGSAFQKQEAYIYSKAIQFIPFLACKRIHQLFCFVDGFLMLICRVKYLFVPLSPFCHSVYPVLVTHFIYLCAWLHSCAHVFFIMLFHCHPVSTQSIQCGLLEGLAGQSVFTSSAIHSASWSAWKKGGEEKKPCEKKSSTMNTEEVHNANSFPNTTDCFKHNERKPALLAELHFNKQQTHKGLATPGLFPDKTSSTV